MSDFSVAPYYDDYNEDKKFVRILYRPGYSVQTRELNQMQSIIQNQITRFGNNVFKEGSVVIPGTMSVDTKIKYVKLQSLYNADNIETYIDDLVGSTVTGSASSIKAKVIAVAKSTDTEPPVLMVKYVDSGTSTTKEFINTETLTSDITTVSGNVRVVKTIDTGTVSGDGSVAHVNKGVYYIRGHFVLSDDQTIILDKFSNTPSYRIGFEIVEDIAVPEVDTSLLDNANGEYNYAAPGAHRYTIVLNLATRIIDAVDYGNFIEIQRVIQGSQQRESSLSDYNMIEKALAQRTYDESGDYAVTPFKFQVREHRNNDRGPWESGKAYLIGDIATNSGYTFVALNAGTSGAVAPTLLTGTNNDGAVTWVYSANPSYNRGIYTPEAGGIESKLAIGVDPGKAYVQGHVVEKTGTEYVAVDKARTFDLATRDIIPTTVGDYVLVSNLNGVPECSKFGAVSLYDQMTTSVGTPAGNLIGTANIRAIEYESGTVGTQTAVYRLYVFNVNMIAGKSFGRDVKQFYYNAGTAVLSFTADVTFNSVVSTQLTGSISVASTAVTGTGTLFVSQLKVGDYVYANGGYGRVSAIATDTALTLAAASITNTTAGQPVVVYRLETACPENISNTSLLFPLSAPYIKSVRGSGGAYNTGYFVSQRFTKTASSNSISFGINETTDTTSSGSEFSYADTKKTIIFNVTTGKISSGVVSGTSTSMTISGLSTVGSTPTDIYCVYTPVYKAAANALEKTKTKVTNATIDFTTAAAASVMNLYLGKADCIRVSKVERCTAFGVYNATGAVDITTQFTFNDGQTESAYGQSFITRIAGNPVPTGTIRVTFDYFNHSAGDYFSVDSYSSIRYEDIPTAKDSSNNLIRLSDVLDFRPRTGDGAAIFTGTGSSLTQIPKFSFSTIADYSYYLGRTDKISLNVYGEYVDIMGIPSLKPIEPADLSNGMTVAKINLAPYGLTTGYSVVTPVDNKRYTMRDIGKIEKRLENVEYYTSLNQLETETSNMKIVDEYGLDRYKNGFLTDSFAGQGVGDTTSVDYLCAIDMDAHVLNPHYQMDNVPLIEKNSQNSQRVTDGYAVTGDLITLPYTHESFIKQPYATRIQNVTPYMVFNFSGSMKLNPSTDVWFDVNRRPDIIKNVEGNFNAIRDAAQKAGIIKTVMSNWISQNGSHTPGFWRRDTTTTDVTEVLVNVVEGDNVVASSIIPFIRSRTVKFVGKAMKPSINVFATFEDVSVTPYITPATLFTTTSISGKSSTFDLVTKIGNGVEETARKTLIGIDTAFDEGDVIYVSKTAGGVIYPSAATSIGTAVIGLQEEFPEDTKHYLHVVNVKGTFGIGDEITGTLSGASVTITAMTNGTLGGQLKTSPIGNICGTFTIPNTDAMHFRTGTKTFSLSDITGSTNIGLQTTKGVGTYTAAGTLNAMQRTIISTRNGIVETTVKQGEWVWLADPLAQSFAVNSSGGVFLTKLDLYFASKDSVVPVKVQIREVVNGYPSATVVPFSNVTLMPSEVHLDVATGTVPTTCMFESPVYLKDQTEYCIVIMSDSNNYNVWISQLGDQEVGTTRYVSTQPVLGSLFLSQNNSTWTADQTQDLKFTLYRANFSTSTGTVNLVNQALPSANLGALCFKTVNGSNIVRVKHYHHGMPNGKKVALTGSTADQNGIPFAQLNATFTISNVTLDSYTITTASNATSTGLCGQATVAATYDLQYDIINPMVSVLDFKETDVTFALSGYTGQTVGGSETPYLNTISRNLTINAENVLSAPGTVTSTVNAPLDGLSNPIKTLAIAATLKTSNPNISPVIDMGQCGVMLANNRVYPSVSTDNAATIDWITVVAAATDIAFNGKTITATTAGTKSAFLTIPSGATITVSGSAANNFSFTVASVSSDGSTITVTSNLTTAVAGAAITIVMGTNYISEIASSGSTGASKYLTKRIDFLNASTFLKVAFAANCPPDADIDVYYKLLPVGSNVPMEQIPYTSAVGTYTVTKTQTPNKFIDIAFETPNNLSFISAVVKLVMRSTSSSNVPRVKSLRVIACA